VAEPGRGHWWTTLPGVLTGTAALVTALTGLAVGLGQLGVIGGADADGSSQARPAVSSGTAASAAPSATAVRPVAAMTTTLPLGQPFRIGEASYELLDALVRPDADGLLALELSVRMTKHTPFDANFWDDSFRVVVGPDVYAASGGLNELVAGQSSGTGDVLVLVPDTTRQAELVLRFRGDSRTVPFEIVPAGD
jgi:hypothetical protein